MYLDYLAAFSFQLVLTVDPKKTLSKPINFLVCFLF